MPEKRKWIPRQMPPPLGLQLSLVLSHILMFAAPARTQAEQVHADALNGCEELVRIVDKASKSDFEASPSNRRSKFMDAIYASSAARGIILGSNFYVWPGKRSIDIATKFGVGGYILVFPRLPCTSICRGIAAPILRAKDSPVVFSYGDVVPYFQRSFPTSGLSDESDMYFAADRQGYLVHILSGGRTLKGTGEFFKVARLVEAVTADSIHHEKRPFVEACLEIKRRDN